MCFKSAQTLVKPLAPQMQMMTSQVLIKKKTLFCYFVKKKIVIPLNLNA